MSTTMPMTVDEAKAELQNAEDLVTAATLEVANLKARVKVLQAAHDKAVADAQAGQDDLTLAKDQEATAEKELADAKAKEKKAQDDLKNAQAAAQGM